MDEFPDPSVHPKGCEDDNTLQRIDDDVDIPE